MPRADPSAYCRACRAVAPEEGRTRCAACSAARRAEDAARRALARAKGRCVSCGARALRGYSVCEAHREYYRARSAAQAERERAIVRAETAEDAARLSGWDYPAGPHRAHAIHPVVT